MDDAVIPLYLTESDIEIATYIYFNSQICYKNMNIHEHINCSS